MMVDILKDIHEEIGESIKDGFFQKLDATESLYADDTMLVGGRSEEINIFLSAFKRHSKKHDPKFKKDECNYIGMNATAKIGFLDSTKVQNTGEAGTRMTSRHKARTELGKYVGNDSCHGKKLDLFIRRSKMRRRRRRMRRGRME